MPGGIDLHSHIGGGKVNIARMMLPEEHRAHLPAPRTAAAAAAAAMPARPPSPPATPMPAWATPWRSSRRCCRSTRARRTRRWPTSRCWTKAPTSLLGNDDLFLELVQGGCRAGRDPRLCRLDACRRPRRWRSRSSIPAGSAPSSSTAASSTSTRPGPFYGITPRTILTTLADARDRARRAAPDPRPRLQPGRARRRRHHARHHRGHGRPAASTSPTCSSTATARRARPASPAVPAPIAELVNAQPQRLGRHRPGDVRPDRDRVRRHDEPGPQRPLRLARRSGWRWTSSARPAAACCRSATATRTWSTRCNGASASSCSC